MGMHLASRNLAVAAAVVAVALSMVAAAGCSTTQARPDWLQTLTFWDKQEEDPRFKGPTPTQRISKLRELAADLPDLPATEQQSHAAELAQAYRVEADPLVRCEIVRTTAWCGSPTAAETLRLALNDSEKDVRLAACEAWSMHGGPQAVSQLGEALRKDADVDVRLAAARALGKIQGPEATTALGAALEDSDPAMQYRAVQSLREMTGKDFGDDVNAWREYVRGGTPQEISVAERLKLKAL